MHERWASKFMSTCDRSKRARIFPLVGAVAISGFVAYNLLTNFRVTASPKRPQLQLNNKDCSLILTCSAPGKIILTGEHAVVHGVTAIATAIDKRTVVRLFEIKKQINDHDAIILKFSNNECLKWKLSNIQSIYAKKIQPTLRQTSLVLNFLISLQIF